MWAATIAHNGMIAAGRTADWASHRIEHEISAIYDITHGAGMAIVFPAWMEYVKDENIERFSEFAVKVFGVKVDEDKEKTALRGIVELKKFFKNLKMKTSLGEAGIGEENFEMMAEKALAGNVTLGRFKKLTKDDIVNILKMSK